MTLGLLNPAMSDHAGHPSFNLGDLIIQESIQRELAKTFGDRPQLSVSTHIPLGPEQFAALQPCEHLLVCGTNLLTSYMDEYSQWKINLRDAARIGRAQLFGVGWWTYQGKPNLYTQLILRMVLSGKGLHSVRDGYTEKQLRSIGIKNVINTGCPTMWGLAEIAPHQYPTHKAQNALVMLTDYSAKPELDRRLLEIALANYETVYVWPQGLEDKTYIQSFNLPVQLLEYSYADLQRFLASGLDFDYIGTRLHGGIKCLQQKRRALILAIDNRAQEISRDTNLPTVQRDEFDQMQQWILGAPAPQIQLNLAAIATWRQQFALQGASSPESELRAA
jgi:polysaccharide pyruvyl transferase WcaK-like protein